MQTQALANIKLYKQKDAFINFLNHSQKRQKNLSPWLNQALTERNNSLEN